MPEQSSDPHPLSNLAYDWITLMQNKAQALLAYDQYIKDAEAAGSAECAAFFRKTDAGVDIIAAIHQAIEQKQ